MNVARNRWFSSRIDSKMLMFALFVGFLSGFVGMCVDIDHFWGGRAAHTPALIIALCIVVYCCASLGRLYIRMVLEKKKE